MFEWLANPSGIVLRRDVAAAGIDDKALHAAVRQGRLHRLRQGAYVLTPAWQQADPIDRYRLLVHAVATQYGGRPVARSHVSACIEQGGPNWGLDLSAAHLTHLDGTHGRREASIVHHHGKCHVDDLTRDVDGWITSPTRTALDTASIVPRESAVVVLDWYLQRQLTTPEHLWQRFEAMKAWPDTLGLQMALRLADGRSESVGETRARLLLRDQRLPAPIPQLEIYGPNRRLIGRVDFAWPDLKVIVEFDGLVKYHRYRRPGESIEEAVIREKRREDDLREATGWTVVRLVWADLSRPDEVAARIRRAARIAA